MNYRKEIDGLRAVALIPVLFFHAGFESLSGGFVGVDVFFVISGYLITSLILGEKRAGTFSLANFYERRARRILPALFLVVFACMPFAWLWMLPHEMKYFANSVIANSIFLSNLYFSTFGSYFGAVTETMPLLHTWSLAIEEQFYALFPLLLLLSWNRGRRWLISVVLAIAACSFLFAQLGGNLNFAPPYIEPELRWFDQPRWGSFYMTPGRVWELMFGAAIAIYALGKSLPDTRWNQYLAALGIAMIAYATVVFDSLTPFPSVYSLIPTVGTVLVITFASSNTMVGRLLSMPLLVGIGLISYSAYLWHLPLFAFSRLRSIREPEMWVYLVLMAVTFVLAYLSWHFVEKPFRNRQRTNRNHVVYVAVVATTAALAFGIAGHRSEGFESRVTADVGAMLEYRKYTDMGLDFCRPNFHPANVAESQCVVGAQTPPSIALLGDSHARALAHQFGVRANETNKSVSMLIRDGCAPVTGLFFPGTPEYRDCDPFNMFVYEHLARNEATNVIVLVARWTGYMESDRFDNEEGGRESGLPMFVAPLGDDGWVRDESVRKHLVAEAFAEGIREFLEMGKTVILVYPIPEVGWNVPEYLARTRMLDEKLPEPLTTSFERFRRRNDDAYSALDGVGEHLNLHRLYPADVLCDTYVEQRCIAQLDGIPLYFDSNHLSIAGSALVIDPIIRKIMGLDGIRE